MKNNKVHTCYGCKYFHKNKYYEYNVKHCGQDSFKCPYFWGTGEPLGLNKKYIGFYHVLREFANINTKI